MAKVILVANRLPVRVEMRRSGPVLRQSPGGLATGLGALHRLSESLWIGWPGLPAELNEAFTPALMGRLLKRRFVPVLLNAEEVERYYQGFANQTLWPLFHSFTTYAEFNRQSWETYRRINLRFAAKVKEHYQPGDLIWVHDYHLMLLPSLLRAELPEARIGFFLHIPFPPYDVLRLLPWHRPLLEGLLGADLVGFHTDDYVLHFLEAVQRVLGLSAELGQILLPERKVAVDVFPMGVDFGFFHRALADPAVRRAVGAIRQRFAGKKLILSVDRLDYTKGIPQRLHAFARLLELEPSLRGKVNLILQVVPSRSDTGSYGALTAEVERLVSEINGRFGNLGWVPVRYICRSLPQSELVTLYLATDVMLVTPLRDGMNLVAKEFVASRSDRRGVLVLSERAGAAKELPEALIVNPDDVDETALALKKALTMPLPMQAERIRAMQERLRRGNVAQWAKGFLDRLAGDGLALPAAPPLAERAQAELVRRYRAAERRLLLLDYDGTLLPFRRRPAEARPDHELLELLTRLAADDKNDVVVVSGRNRRPLGSWLEPLPIHVVAEHGAWFRPPGGRWRAYARLDVSWKAQVRAVLERYVAVTPGSFLEDKTFALAWHYRQVSEQLAARRAHELEHALRRLGLPPHLGVLPGQKVLEVRDVRVHKGLVTSAWLDTGPYDFVLAVGDDRTDEDLFALLPRHAWTIKVGSAPTRARFSLPDPAAVRCLLSELAPVAKAVAHGA